MRTSSILLLLVASGMLAGVAASSTLSAVPSGATLVSSTASRFGNGWYAGAVDIAAACADPSCSSATLLVGDSPIASMHACEVEGVPGIGVRVARPSGATEESASVVGCDLTPPEVRWPRLATPVWVVDGLPYSSSVPGWTWDASADALSGLYGYEIQLSTFPAGPTSAGVMLPPEELAWTPETIDDGMSCLALRPHDRAGNTPPWPGESCVFIDRVAPTVTIAQPQAGMLTVHDRPIPIRSDHRVVIGPTTWIARAHDVGTADAASGMWSTQLSDLRTSVLIGVPPGVGPSRTPRACFYATEAECRVLDTTRALGPRAMEYTYIADTEDFARNQASAEATVLRVQLAVVESATGTQPAGDIYWETAEVPGLRGYVVVRWDASLPPAPPTLVCRTDAAQTSCADAAVLTGHPYVYGVLALGDTIASTHLARMRYEGEAGTISMPVR